LLRNAQNHNNKMKQAKDITQKRYLPHLDLPDTRCFQFIFS
jgi:hypothetical protein